MPAVVRTIPTRTSRRLVGAGGAVVCCSMGTIVVVVSSSISSIYVFQNIFLFSENWFKDLTPQETRKEMIGGETKHQQQNKEEVQELWESEKKLSELEELEKVLRLRILTVLFLKQYVRQDILEYKRLEALNQLPSSSS